MIDSIVGNLSLSKNGFILLLRPRLSPLNRMLPILIGVAEAQSIALALARKPTPRPMTHDLMKGLLDALGVSLKRVEIVRFEGKTYFAQLLLSRAGVALEPVDARPSDAIALALRCSAPIMVAEAVYEKGGVDIPAETGATPPSIPHPLVDPRKQLEEEMKKAVQEERYEDAARIRDQLNQLDHH